MSSIEYIRASPGFPWGSWPPFDGLSLDENLRDLKQHADDFKRRVGFTYTVLDNENRFIGCVYIYPCGSDPKVTNVRSWVTASRGELDTVLPHAVSNWLAVYWPFATVSYRDDV